MENEKIMQTKTSKMILFIVPSIPRSVAFLSVTAVLLLLTSGLLDASKVDALRFRMRPSCNGGGTVHFQGLSPPVAAVAMNAERSNLL